MAQRGNHLAAHDRDAHGPAKPRELRGIKSCQFFFASQPGHERFQLSGIVDPPVKRGPGDTNHRACFEDFQRNPIISIEGEFTTPKVVGEPREQIPNLMLFEIEQKAFRHDHRGSIGG